MILEINKNAIEVKKQILEFLNKKL